MPPTAMTNTRVTCLERLEEQLNVDVDCIDTEWIKSMATKFGIKFHDQTSNQIFVDRAIGHESNKELLLETAKELKNEGWLKIYTRVAVLLCKKNIDLISGRVFLQTLPSKAYDIDATLAHARLYDDEFARADIPRDRFCIKIPATGPALNAASMLQAEGIQTLGTALFSVPQAIACSQAGCMYISPYYNELKAHLDKSVWPDLEDPALNHPMSARLIQILEMYNRLYKGTGKQQPLLKNASFISLQETLASGEMGCHSATIPSDILEELARTAYDPAMQPGAGEPGMAKKGNYYEDGVPVIPQRLKHLLNQDPLASPTWDGKPASTDVDYLGDGGEKLQEYILADPATKQRLDDALKVFIEAENLSKQKIEAVVRLVSC